MSVTPESDVITETTWNEQTRNLAILSHLLLQDLQNVETLFCLDLKNSINYTQGFDGSKRTSSRQLCSTQAAVKRDRRPCLGSARRDSTTR